MSATAQERTGGWFSGRGYVLAVLTALSAMNQLDRQIMNILIEPVRREFGLSDIQLGLLSGLAFVALYSVLSVPAAIYAMYRSRRTLLAVSAAVWGAMTIACGLAQSYAQLLVARLGVGVGEAGGMPPSHAIISDLYAPHERATAMATWSAGINIGIFFAYLGGGLIGHRYGWRTAFFAAGILTVALACLLRLTVREPPRTASSSATPPSLAAVKNTLAALWSDPALRHIWIGATITTIVGYSALAWIPSYLVRSQGMTIASAGAYLAIVAGAGGALGTWLGGKWSDALRRRDIRWSLWLIAVIFALSKPLNIGFLTINTTMVALALFVIPAMLATTFLGPSLAVIHNRVDATLRPLASALFLLVVNLIGLGVGPLLTGALSQWAFAGHGADSLRYALVVTQMIGFWGAAHFYIAGRNLKPDATSS
jgi:predicted MFS family arabinose efflux permease